MKLIKHVVWVAALSTSASWAAMAGTSDPSSVTTPAMTPDLEVGKKAYGTYCASCHGANAVGTDKGPPFLHRVYHPGHHSDQAFYMAPRQGARAHHWKFGDMKPVEGVSDSELEAIVKYVRALQKANGIF